ncbi:hypothetical protein GH714_003606 [Hevea brasiliensis]|uniref:GH18 domain-containing protein n=1 Tax=Hevea brasiliensis TaxID=3981 RepID=A0A6A6K534_HEVBR|nr:hypothetical protein GH714_003606 [Hevea brasiliensis]
MEIGLLKLFPALLIILQALSTTHISILQLADAANSKLFREYIGANFKNVAFDEPFPSFLHQESAFKCQRSFEPWRDTVGNDPAFFKPSSVESWRANAVSSLTQIIKNYNLDGIDIDYEHFQSDPDTFAASVGGLIETLKTNKVISFASIAPYPEVQSYYLALWKSYGNLIDYVNFQFYAYDKGTTVSQFLDYFETQSSNYNGGKILTSFESNGNRGLSPENGFFTACDTLKNQQKLHGIFVWCADDSKNNGFQYERQSQELLAEKYYCGFLVKVLKMGFFWTSDPGPLLEGTVPVICQLPIYLGSGVDNPSDVSSIKNQNSNVKVALSLGGDVQGGYAYFSPSSVNSWVSNAVSTLTDIIQQYNLDGIDIDYEHFQTDPDTFTECIGQLISTLKRNGVISFASIAPFDDDQVQGHYQALWKKYGHLIDYVNFQFYAYDQGTTVSQFMSYFNTQSSNYNGGKVLVSFISDGSGGLAPDDGFFTACNRLKSRKQLHGIFVWSADDSKANGFRYEKQSQALLAIHH